MATGQLTRSETDKMIAGVAGGMAAYFGLDATLIRVLWAVAGLMGWGLLDVPPQVSQLLRGAASAELAGLLGWGLLAYPILWIVLPKGRGSTPATRAAEERYARGEITAEELQRIRSDLQGGS